MKHTKINKRVIIIALGIDILLILAATIALLLDGNRLLLHGD